jgi:hypothetical protein
MLAYEGCSNMVRRGMKHILELDCNSMVNICTSCMRLNSSRVKYGKVCMKLHSSKVKCGIKNMKSRSMVIYGIDGMGYMKLGNSKVKHSKKYSI